MAAVFGDHPQRERGRHARGDATGDSVNWPTPSTSRLVVRLVVQDPVPIWAQVRFRLLAWGDLIMMRKQLRTLRQLAEQTAGDGSR
jgi:hypothetical protein